MEKPTISLLGRMASLCFLFQLLSTSLPQARAAYQFTDDATCQSCVAGGQVVCRPDYYDRYAFCCDETEVGTRSCAGSSKFCTNMALNPLMNAFACPYSYGYCGAGSSELVMHPENRNNLRIEISNALYVDQETCYYVFSVPASSLDEENMRYFFDIELYEMSNVVISINNGTSLETANDPIEVSFLTGTRFQFTAENNMIFMAFTADVATTSSVDAAFGFTIKLRSFELNPSTDVVPETDGTETETGTDDTETEQTEPDDDTGTETEGSGKIIETEDTSSEEKPDTDSTETNTIIPDDQEQANDTVIIETVTDTTYKYIKKTISQVTEEQKRNPQYGLSLFSACTALGVIIYILFTLITRCQKRTAQKKQISSMNSFNTIEVSSRSAQNIPTASMRVGSNSEQHGLMGAQNGSQNGDDFFANDEKKNRKMKISDAIEDNDAGMKKSFAKKKKKKGGKGKSEKADEGNMLGFSQPNNGIGNESWDSSRGQAQVVDLSAQTPAGVTPAGNRSAAKRSSGYNSKGQAMNAYYAGTPAGGLSNNPSAQQLSAHSALNDIEEAVDLSNRGSRENLHQYGGGFDQATNMVQNNRLGMTMQQNQNSLGLGSHSAMGNSFQARPPATSTSNMMHHNPNDNGFLCTDGNMVVRASHNSKLSKGSLSSVNKSNQNHF